jgi:hypothetical protein
MEVFLGTFLIGIVKNLFLFLSNRYTIMKSAEENCFFIILPAVGYSELPLIDFNSILINLPCIDITKS